MGHRRRGDAVDQSGLQSSENVSDAQWYGRDVERDQRALRAFIASWHPYPLCLHLVNAGHLILGHGVGKSHLGDAKRHEATFFEALEEHRIHALAYMVDFS